MKRDLDRAKSGFGPAYGTRSSRRFHVLAAVLVCAVLTSTATGSSVARKKEIARDHFEAAERMREALNGRPAAQRTLRDYTRLMDAYRKVYYAAPSSAKADDAIVAVAELLAEKGRRFKNQETLKDAIGQYKFLRREYPGSTFRAEALFTIAQIYKEDLHDEENARATFQEFLKSYGHSQLAEEARQALKEMDDAASASVKSASQKTPAKPDKAEDKPSNDRPSRTTLVTGIRHWSTPDYTRVAIDLEEEVNFGAGRIGNPDRIYFDLKETRLSSVLRGKSFDVEDGFLKKIRAAQFGPGVTRVVLEVGDDVGEYSAFLLPNPSRLIIDIHGKKTAKLMARTKQPKPVKNNADDSESEKTNSKETADVASAKKKPATGKAPEVAKTEPKETRKAEKKTKTEVAKSGVTAPPKSADSDKASEQNASVAPDTVTTAQKQVATKIVEPDPEPKTVETVAKVASEPAPKEELPLRVRGKKRQAPEKLSVRTAKPTIDGDRSLIRALGLKIGRIVVDAGHGGHDTGTIGPKGLLEKDLALDVALRLGKLLETRLGAEVIYTRDDDTFVPLETRTAIANQHQADLFISVHANSSRDASARGVETYYLNFTSSRDALEVAARENAVSDKSIHELQDLVKKIALKDKIDESREFALNVQNALYRGIGAGAIRDRGVKKAPFIVLIGANMPSILAEISFISNPTDERKLKGSEYRQKIADSLYNGVAKYVSGLSGVKVAAKFDKEEGD